MSLDIATHRLADAEPHVHFCLLSPEGKHVACALSNGTVVVLNAITFAVVARGAPGLELAGLPATCVRWAPPSAGNDWCLVSSSCCGSVVLWSWDTNESALRRGTVATEGKNEVMVVDVSPTGKRVLSAGSDRIVRLYNAKLVLLAQLTEGFDADGTSRPTHTNRIFSARFVSEAAAVSAGWASPVQLWDLRTCCSNRQAVGIVGGADCLEPIPDAHLVLVASPKLPESLQIIDSVTGRALDENSQTACSELDSRERVAVCRFQADAGLVWCLTLSPPSLIVLSLSSGRVAARAMLPATPLNMSLDATGALICCKAGVLLQASLVM